MCYILASVAAPEAAGGAPREKQPGRGNGHVAKTYVRTACPVPRKATNRDAPAAMSPDPVTPKPFSYYGSKPGFVGYRDLVNNTPGCVFKITFTRRHKLALEEIPLYFMFEARQRWRFSYI